METKGKDGKNGKNKKIKARSGGKINISASTANNASKIKARTGGVINIVNPTDTIYRTDTVKVPVIKKDTVYVKRKIVKPTPKPTPKPKPKTTPTPKMKQPIVRQDNTRVDVSNVERRAKTIKVGPKEKSFKDFFPSNINMTGAAKAKLKRKDAMKKGDVGGPKMMGMRKARKSIKKGVASGDVFGSNNKCS